MTTTTIPIRRISRGFSFVELLAVTGALFVIAATVTPAISSFIGRSKDVKLDQDIKVLNAAVNAYLTFGGHLDADDTAATVVQKLKTRAVVAEADEVTGLSGQFIDPRIEIVMQSTLEADTDMNRALWDSVSAKFVLATGGEKGIKRIQFSDDDVPLDGVEEERETLMGYSAEPQSWIWDFQDRPKSGMTELTVVSVAVDPIVPLYSTNPNGPPAFVPKTAAAKQLLMPQFSVPEGLYPITDFDIPITINNPNLLGTSTVSYSVNGGGWQDYPGGTVNIPPLSTLRARALPLPSVTDWSPSKITMGDYDGIHGSGTLDPPTLGFSDPQFITGVVDSVTVTLSNPNSELISRIDYRLNGSNWQTYTGPFQVATAFFPALTPVTVESYAVSTSVYWLDSEEVSDTILASPPGTTPFAIFCASSLREYGVSILDSGTYASASSGAGIEGNVAIGPGGSWTFSNGTITGEVHHHPGTTGSGNGVDDQWGAGGDPVVPIATDLSKIEPEALAMAATAAAFPATQTYGTINSEMTLTASGPDDQTVINIGDINLNAGEILTINGGADDFVILNISGGVNMVGGSTWRVTGGIKVSHILFNMAPGADFKGSGGSGEITGAVILAPHPGSDVTITGSSVVKGAVVCGGKFEAKGGAQVFSTACLE